MKVIAARKEHMTYNDLKQDIGFINFNIQSLHEELEKGNKWIDDWMKDRWIYEAEYSSSPLVDPDDVDAMIENEHKRYEKNANSHYKKAEEIGKELQQYREKYGNEVMDVLENSKITEFNTSEEYKTLFYCLNELQNQEEISDEIDPSLLGEAIEKAYDSIATGEAIDDIVVSRQVEESEVAL